MGLCSLGTLVWRINPNSIDWNFQVQTSIQDTVGGRVVQVLGAKLSDITIKGSYGEDRFAEAASRPTRTQDAIPGKSWLMADNFVKAIRRRMIDQATPPDASGFHQPKPLRFLYPPLGYDFMVFVKSIADAEGENSVIHKTGKFSYGYTLTLFPVADNTLQLMGDTNSIKKASNAAVAQALARISEGMGWSKSQFNQPDLDGIAAYGDYNGSGIATDTSANTPNTVGSHQSNDAEGVQKNKNGIGFQ